MRRQSRHWRPAAAAFFAFSRAVHHHWSMVLFVFVSCCCFSLSHASKRQLSNAFVLSQQRRSTPALFVASSVIPRRGHTNLINNNNNNNMSPTNGQQQVGTSQEDERPIRAKIVSFDKLPECGARLREGNLVAFPTETVYGLGCHALDPSAINKVFQAKERPLTDPLIVHVTKDEDAFALWDAGTEWNMTTVQAKALQALCQQFWPGPLTLVAKAASHVPSIVMANTGFVACRSPSHPIARALIDESRVPLAAPSANKFGHISPTRASHVWDDLLQEDVWIIDGTTSTHTAGADSDDSSSKKDVSVCQVGVESTVAKIEMLEQNGNDKTECGRVTLLRQGAISVEDVKNCLEQAGLSNLIAVEANTKRTTDDHTANVAPGQTIRHYSPRIPSFILAQARCADTTITALSPVDTMYLNGSVVIDFGGQLAAWKSLCLAYRDLSVSGDSSEAANVVFETLRWAEQVPDGKQILFPEIVQEYPLQAEGARVDALTLALKDRLTRAASGVIIETLQ